MRFFKLLTHINTYITQTTVDNFESYCAIKVTVPSKLLCHPRLLKTREDKDKGKISIPGTMTESSVWVV